MTRIKYLLLAMLTIAAIIAMVFIPRSSVKEEARITPSPGITASPTVQAVPTAAASPSSAGSNLFISPQGDDANPGSRERPWRSIQYAVDQAKPGQVIMIQSGTYQEAVHITRPGEVDRPVTLTSIGGGKVTIDGGENPALTGEADYWVIQGLNLTSEADRTLKISSSFWKIQKNKITGAVYFWGNNHLFEENEVDGSQHLGNENGVMDDGPSSHHNIFRGNEVHDFALRGFWSQWLTHDNLFQSNLIYNITSETGMGIDLDAASNVGYRHVIRANTIHDCGQTGIELENSYESVVENNIVYNTGLEGIQVINYQGCAAAGESNQYGQADGDCRGDDLDTIVRQNLIMNGGRVGGIVSYQSSGVKLYNNTVYGSAAGLYILGDAALAGNWDVQGNIFAYNTRVQVSLDDSASLLFDAYNLLYQADGNDVYEIRRTESVFYTVAAWEQTFGLGQGSVQADPMFVNPPAHDFRLRAGSPAVDSGRDLQITADIENNPRPAGKNFDMGVYEQ